MNKHNYAATLIEQRSDYGMELDIAVPGSKHPVIVAQDVYGEAAERMQVIIYPSGEGPEMEDAVSIRFNTDGSIAEVRGCPTAPVSKWDASEPTNWLRERDGRKTAS